MRRPTTILLTVCFVTVVAASASAQSPEPPPYPEDAGIMFEPVGPAAWRVVEPDLDCERRPFWAGMSVAPDGRVWFLDRALGIRELGACPLPVEGGPNNLVPRDQALAPDGTLWVLDGDRLMSWNGSAWVIHAEGEFNILECSIGGRPATPAEVDERGGQCGLPCEEQPCYSFLDIAPDGAVWLSGYPGWNTLGVHDGERWREYTEDWILGPLLGFGPDGAVWVVGRDGAYVFHP